MDITAALKYQSETAEGTGMILSASGLVLTNNHVIDGATQVKAALVGNPARTYSARVIGYDSSADVALLQLTGAADLPTVSFGNSDQVSVGAQVLALDLPGSGPWHAGSCPATVAALAARTATRTRRLIESLRVAGRSSLSNNRAVPAMNRFRGSVFAAALVIALAVPAARAPTSPDLPSILISRQLAEQEHLSAGDTVTQLQHIGHIETSKAESDLYAPLAGTLMAFNRDLLKDPSAINVDKYGAGWLFEMEGATDLLRDVAGYHEYLAANWEKTQRLIKGKINTED